MAKSAANMEQADLEGTDGQLYKGRVNRKVSFLNYN